jgi:hypothetical protein
MADGHHVSVRGAAVVGLASLAAAMGIGRFAFTPLRETQQARGARGASSAGVAVTALWLSS